MADLLPVLPRAGQDLARWLFGKPYEWWTESDGAGGRRLVLLPAWWHEAWQAPDA